MQLNILERLFSKAENSTVPLLYIVNLIDVEMAQKTIHNFKPNRVFATTSRMKSNNLDKYSVFNTILTLFVMQLTEELQAKHQWYENLGGNVGHEDEEMYMDDVRRLAFQLHTLELRLLRHKVGYSISNAFIQNLDVLDKVIASNTVSISR